MQGKSTSSEELKMAYEDFPPVKKPFSDARSILFYSTGEASDFRMRLPATWLAREGLITEYAVHPAIPNWEKADIVVFLRPHITRESLQTLSQCIRAGKTIVVDIDDDFHNIPPGHPGYYHCGPGNPGLLRALELAIRSATVLVVSTPVLAERYGALAQTTLVIPNGWDSENPNWNKPLPQRQKLRIGWAGTTTHLEDMRLIRAELIHFLRTYPEVQLVIGGDARIMDLFAPLPERQRIFLPFRPYREYPDLLAEFDILLAPLADTPFNRAKSDVKLVEAGARRIPWVASALPAYRSWRVGGILAESPASWPDALATLVEDTDLRFQLGEAGRKHSEQRNRLVMRLWLELIQALIPSF
jgi:glycosyltransferase involved in cell wall biosynthesis